MEQHELLRYVAATLDQQEIPYYVTGSFAGILYGPFRMTNDIDIVVDLKREHIDTFLAAFPTDSFYFDRDAVLDAVQTRFQFNIIHKESFAKVDFILPERTLHDREVFQRSKRIRGTVDYDVAYCAPEDIILKKLKFHAQSDSPKHLSDVVGILKMMGPRLDLPYIEKWADWLNIVPSWNKARALSAPSQVEGTEP